MKVLQVYNQQRSVFGGEEAVVALIEATLSKHGHDVSLWQESSRGIESSSLKKIRAAINGVFSLSAYKRMREQLRVHQPDIVHVHCVYPVLSPSVLVACRAEQVPSVFHVHSHILTCPNWYHLRDGKICELCVGGKEYNCLLTNCRGSFAESAAYALRSWFANRFDLFRNNATLFIAVSEFIGDRLIANGYPAERVHTLPNGVPFGTSDPIQIAGAGEYIGYSGRLSPEKGLSTLIKAAGMTGLPIRIAGDGSEAKALRAQAPGNVEFLGKLSGADLDTFYAKSRFIVVPSRCFETFSLAAAEAMAHGKPVIASRIGALPELIEDGVNGLLFEPDNAEALSRQLSCLWNDVLKCAEYGRRARQWADRMCHQRVFYDRLIGLYEHAITMNKSANNFGGTHLQHVAL